MTEEGLAMRLEDSSSDPKDEGHHVNVPEGGTVRRARVACSPARVRSCCVLESFGLEGRFDCLWVVHGTCEFQDKGASLTPIVGHTVGPTVVFARFLLGILPL